MERRNLKDNMSVGDLENLFNAYKEHLDFRAASLKGQPKTDRNPDKPKDSGKKEKTNPQKKPFDLSNLTQGGNVRSE